MKISFVIPYHNNLYDSILALKDEHDVSVLTPRRVKPIPSQIPAEICSALNTPFGSLLSLRCLWRSLRSRPDLVVVKHVFTPTNLLVYLFCKIKSLRYAISIQKFQHPKGKLFDLFFRLLLRWIGKDTPIFSVTRKGAHDARRYFSDAQYLPACIDHRRFQSRREDFVSGDKLRIICVSKYIRRKNIDVLILAFEKLVNRYPRIDFHLKIIGSDVSAKGVRPNVAAQRVYGLIEGLIKEKGLGSRIKLRKNVENRRMPHEYTSSDIFVFPASSEPLGYALLEAMASGLPVICSDEVGAKSYVRSGINGFIVKPRGKRLLVGAVESFIRGGKVDIGKLKRFGKASRQIVLQDHTKEVFKRGFERFICKEWRYFELFGLPASGKTSMIRRLDNKVLVERDLDSGRAKILTKFPYRFAASLFVFMMKSRLFNLRMYRTMIVKYHFFLKHRSERYVTDHGFIQSLLIDERVIRKLVDRPDILARFLDMLPPGNYLMLDTAIDESLEREMKRRKFRDEDKISLRERYELYVRLFRAILDKHRQSRKIRSKKELDKALEGVIR